MPSQTIRACARCCFFLDDRRPILLCSA